jgi:hypothetical protein
MHDVAPAPTAAVADRITNSDLQDQALRDLAAFVHGTLVKDDHTCAVRIDAIFAGRPPRLSSISGHEPSVDHDGKVPPALRVCVELQAELDPVDDQVEPAVVDAIDEDHARVRALSPAQSRRIAGKSRTLCVTGIRPSVAASASTSSSSRPSSASA